MEFSEWEPVYEQIRREFGYPRAADEQARDLLRELLDGPTYDVEQITLEGKTVAIAGAADSLEAETAQATAADVVFAASTAADRLLAQDVTVDVMVTDLDKNPETVRELTTAGTPVAVHAHGDNRDALREYVPTFETKFLVPTTQAQPSGPVRNFGGFTDGDRAAFLADALGAEQLVFPGWKFDDASVDPEKRQKLRWAARLLSWLEERREERFDVLEGHRKTFVECSTVNDTKRK